MNYSNHWRKIIEIKGRMYDVVKPIIKRYIGRSFDERVINSLKAEINNILVKNNIEAACEIKVETDGKGVFEAITDIKINYLYI
jgi:hypothetical protein